MFKVVPDQLRVSEGWVRCGNCAQVFDASQHLQDLAHAADQAFTAADASAPVETPAPPPDDSARMGSPVPRATQEDWRPRSVPITPMASSRTRPSSFAGLESSGGEATGPQSAPPPAAPVRTSPAPSLPVFVDRPRTRPSSLAAAAAATATAPAVSPPDPKTATPAEAPGDRAGTRSPSAEEPWPRTPATQQAPFATDPSVPLVKPIDIEPAPLARSAESGPWGQEPHFDLKIPPPPEALGESGAWQEPQEPQGALADVPSEEQVPSVVSNDLSTIAEGAPAPAEPRPVVAASRPPGDFAAGQYADQAETRAGDTQFEVRESTLQSMEFVRRARRQAFWAQPSVRALGWFVCLILVVVLAVQFLITERDRMAATYPDMKPGLQSLCASMGCEVQPYRKIDSIAIESSAFDRTRNEEFQFSVVVRNRSNMSLAMPHLELALTDARDRVLARRIFSASDLGAGPVLGPRADWSAALPVALTSGASPSLVAGYRLVAFYP